MGLDGTHVKTMYKGQILSAVAVDPNNCMFPLAYAVVESEKADTWRWFMRLFKEDFDMGNGQGWTLISDRQKGLINVVGEEVPAAEHRYCVRHLHNNFKQKFPGRSLKDKLWCCARTTTIDRYAEYMESIKAENPQAYDWLAQIPAHHWSRSHFQLDNKCDILLNNMCEAFNRSIVFARQQGILVMLEMIREYLMRRIQSKREECELWRYLKITPNANKLLNKFRIWSGGCYSAYAGYNQYEINTVSGHKFSVDLNTRTCGCRRWDLTGIPCHHAICAMNRNGVDPVDYVDVVYSVKTYRACYSGIVYPMNGEAQWTKTGHVVTPPFVQKQPGRPKLKRKHDGNDLQEREEVHGVGATLARNSQMTVRCSVCNQAGHNRRTCKKASTSRSEADGGAADDEREDPPDCILEMDVPEANIPTQGSQVGNVETVSNVAWPGSLWQLKLSGQLGQPGMTMYLPHSSYQPLKLACTRRS